MVGERGSICPTNWSLPDFTKQVGEKNGTAPSYNNLTAAYDIVANTEGGVNRILSIPLSFPRAGSFGDGGLNDRSSSGNGYYWSSRPSSSAYSYLLYFGSTADINRGNVNARRGGRSVRCVVGEMEGPCPFHEVLNLWYYSSI